MLLDVKRREEEETHQRLKTVCFVILRVNELTGQTWHFEMLIGQSIFVYISAAYSHAL